MLSCHKQSIAVLYLVMSLSLAIHAEIKFRVRNPSPVTVIVGTLPGFANYPLIDVNAMALFPVIDIQEIPSQIQTDAEFAPSAPVYGTPDDVIVMREAPLGIAGRESAMHDYDSAILASAMSVKEFLGSGMVGAFKVVSMREDLGKGYVSVQVGGGHLFVETNPTIQDIPPELIVASVPIKR